MTTRVIGSLDQTDPAAIEDPGPSVPSHDRTVHEGELTPAGRAWWTVAGMTVLLWGFQLFGYVDLYPIISLAVVVLGLWGLGTIVAVWQPRRVRAGVTRVLVATTLSLTIGAFLLWSYLQVLSTPCLLYTSQVSPDGQSLYDFVGTPSFGNIQVFPLSP